MPDVPEERLTNSGKFWNWVGAVQVDPEHVACVRSASNSEVVPSAVDSARPGCAILRG